MIYNIQIKIVKSGTLNIISIDPLRIELKFIKLCMYWGKYFLTNTHCSLYRTNVDIIIKSYLDPFVPFDICSSGLIFNQINICLENVH